MKTWLLNKASLALLFFLITTTYLTGQTISGQLMDENEQPLIGANVLVQGTTIGTITDIDGNFEITANEGDVLVLSYIGYQEQLITVSGDENLIITLVSDSSNLVSTFIRRKKINFLPLCIFKIESKIL